MSRAQVLAMVCLALAAPALWSGCLTELDSADVARAESSSVTALFNTPGTRQAHRSANYADAVLVQAIDSARTEIDFAIMGFSNDDIIDALVRAHYRGVRLRFVGDASHLEGDTDGYVQMDRLGVEMMVGNLYHIMHDKFFVVDRRIVFVGTGNITGTGFERNDNNWLVIDSPPVAADFTAEFEQMLGGRFGAAKLRLDNGNTYTVGDTQIEVYFSPQEDAMGRILEAVGEATQSVRFYIFAFTKDQVGSALIDRNERFTRYDECCEPAARSALGDAARAACDAELTCETPYVRREVRGVIDRSQLHSNGPYHEAYRLITWGVPIRLDGNETSFQPGDYQAGGGRQHAKTMIIDADTDHAMVVTGSFNWSSSATTANDEVLLVIHSRDVAAQYMEQFEGLWDRATSIGVDHADPGGTVSPGDVVLNEIQWDGYNGDVDPTDAGGDDVSNDEFVELLNTTGHTIDLSMWTLATDTDFVVGFYPGTVIGPYEHFLLVDHNVAPFQDLEPQTAGGAYQDANFVMNTANDPRFLRLNLHNAAFRLRLLDPRGNEIDVAGDGGPPFFGGRNTEGGVVRNRSMERVHPIQPGGSREAWTRCSASRGGEHVREDYREIVIATPGEPNSGGEPEVGDEVTAFREPSP
ncbi:MAG: lamin tail domain-containing protein [Myxococcales bacterium]|nr:lamin tail domain-containing protein [Myxococcales bacterium]MCB9520679.1 lamin tail domain-containing protein [Myxococcales bacterium]